MVRANQTHLTPLLPKIKRDENIVSLFWLLPSRDRWLAPRQHLADFFCFVVGPILTMPDNKSNISVLMQKDEKNKQKIRYDRQSAAHIIYVQ